MVEGVASAVIIGTGIVRARTRPVGGESGGSSVIIFKEVARPRPGNACCSSPRAPPFRALKKPRRRVRLALESGRAGHWQRIRPEICLVGIATFAEGDPMPTDDWNDPPGELRLQGTLRLSAEGIAKVLGDLEARVMHTVWEIGRPSPARVVHERVASRHAVALHTVITVLNKLVAKGLVRREKVDEVLHFQASVSESEFRRRISRRAVEGILSLGPSAVAATFVDILAERDPEQLAKLLTLVRRRMEEG